MNAYQTIVIIALFAILGALMAPSVNAQQTCCTYDGRCVVVKAPRMCPAGSFIS